MSNILFHDGEAIDFAHDLLQEVAQFLDSKLDQLAAEADAAGEAESWCVLDRMEHVAGFGFVACQEYITRIAGVGGKKETLDFGVMRGAVSLVRVVDAAANYWKHKSEWGSSPGSLASRTVDVLRRIGVDPSSDYPAFAVLRFLQGDFPQRFMSIVPGLTAWRDDLLAHRGLPPSDGPG